MARPRGAKEGPVVPDERYHGAWLDGRSGLCGRLISPEQKAQGDALIEEMQDRIIQEFLGGAAGGAGAGDS